MLITVPTKKGRRILFESSRVSYLLAAITHNLRLEWFPIKNVFMVKEDFLHNLPTHCTSHDADHSITGRPVIYYNFDGHCIAIWDIWMNRGIIDINWAHSYRELYYKLNDIQRMEYHW